MDPVAVGALAGLTAETEPNASIARLVQAFALTLSGRGVDAVALLDSAPPPPPGTALAPQHDYAYGFALYAAGRLEEAAAWAGTHLDRCLAEADREGLVGHAYVAVLARAALGEFEEAFATAQLVLSTGATAGQLLFAPDCAVFVVLAFVAIRTGRSTAARSLVGRAAELAGRSDGLPFGSPALIDAARRSVEGATDEAATAYRTLAHGLLARGYVLAAETLELLAALATSDAEAASALTGAGGAAAGELYRAWVAGLGAQASEDAGALVDAGRSLGRLGARDQAMKLLGQAARLYRAHADEAAADEAQAELRALLDESVHTAGGAIDEFGLSDREADIVREVAAGHSNVQIAERLGVSVRTVDSHLRNIRQKTGAVDRDDLARIAGRATIAGERSAS
jgi:DNA-binding CsgD family transcriptional regulator